MREVWKTITEYPDYKVSSFGYVWNTRRERLVKASLDNKGYFRVNLCNEEGWKPIGVHRLVALMFVDGYFEGAVVNHMDGNKQNNLLGNLEWITKGDNTRHAFAMGLNPGRKRIWREAER